MPKSRKGIPLPHVLSIEAKQLTANLRVFEKFLDAPQFGKFTCQCGPRVRCDESVQETDRLVMHGPKRPKVVRLKRSLRPQITSIVVSVHVRECSCFQRLPPQKTRSTKSALREFATADGKTVARERVRYFE
jgi:hypothetical protein